MADDKNKVNGPQPAGDGDEGKRMPRPRIGRQLLFWAVLMGCVLVALSLARKVGEPTEKKVDLSNFNSLLEAGSIETIRVKGESVTASLKAGMAPLERIKLNLPTTYISDHLDEWGQKLPPAQGDRKVLDYERQHNMLPFVIFNVLPFLVLIGIMIYIFNRQLRAVNPKGGGIPFLKGVADYARKEKPEVTFDDVAGIEEAKEDVREVVEFLKNPEKFQRIGGRIPRGMLLVGAPGTGKTLLAKAIAGEAEVPFLSLCGSDFVELFVGVGASRVRELFQKARENPPCIIFLDEIDAVGRKRGTGLGGGHDEREQTLNAILSEMDGFTRNEGIIVLAATNRPDVLDHALLRPGRFDREIVVDMPDVKGREAILKVHARKVRMSREADLATIARGTPGFSGADLEAVVNEAAIIAAVKGKEMVFLDDLEEARDKVCFGREKKSHVLSDEDRRMTAYHESGHALAARLLPDVEPLHKVTVVRRGVALGMTMLLPEKDKYGLRKKECLGTLTMHMAGRAAEEIFCDDISSGAHSDIKVATDLARRMVTQWGMSEALGPVSYSDEEEHVFLGYELAKGKQHGEEMAQKIDEEIRTLLHNAYEDARSICTEHKEDLVIIAEALIKIETLTAEEIDRLLQGETAEQLMAVKEQARQEQQKAEQEQEEQKLQGSPEQDSGGEYPRAAESPA